MGSSQGRHRDPSGGNRVILEPDTLTAKLRLIDELYGSTAGAPSGCDMLLEDGVVNTRDGIGKGRDVRQSRDQVCP